MASASAMPRRRYASQRVISIAHHADGMASWTDTTKYALLLLPLLPILTWIGTNSRSGPSFFLKLTGKLQRKNDALAANENTYPHFPHLLTSACGVDPTQNVRRESSNINKISKSLGFVKPHKTGGSTIAGIINRLVDGRNMTKMIPDDITYLGWPGPFPGNVRGMTDKNNRSTSPQKFDAISNHAVFNHTAFSEHLRSPMITFTILREPVSRTISAYNFFPHWHKSWKIFLEYVRTIDYQNKWQSAVFLNNLGYSLGWYHWNNNSTKYDQDKGRIMDFIDNLERDMDLVLILEHMEESLILFGDALPEIALTELVWHDFKVAAKGQPKEYQMPTASERKELINILTVDRMIYDHFQTRLIESWESRVKMVPALENSKQKLRCLHDFIERNIGNTSLVPNELRQMLTRDSGAYTKYLWEKRKGE